MSTPPDSPPRRALVVHAHPEPDSFSSAQAAAVTDRLRADGLSVDRIDLYAEAWDPVLTRQQFVDVGDYFKPQAEQVRAVATGTLTDPVKTHLDQLLRAPTCSCCRSRCGGSRCRPS